MKLISWNVRGLGKPQAINRLRNSLRGNHPHILFLMETKLDRRRMERVRRSCGFLFGIDVDAVGSRGGLSLGWKPDIDVTLLSFSGSHIDAIIREDDAQWRFTGFYGNPVEHRRSESWSLLRQLESQQNLSWLVVGDFNEITFSFEKKGGRLRNERNMAGFREVLEDFNLSDLGFNGVWYTWERGRLPENNVRERLDRAVANPSWWDLHQNYSVSHLSHTISDHCPILVDTVGQTTQRPMARVEVFRFDANWVLEDEAAQIVKNCWESSSATVLEKLHEIGCALMSWSRDHKKQSTAQKRAMVRKLKELTSCDPDEETLAELTEIKLGLNLEAEKEEYFWEQRSRSNWLHHGDQNTSFFHNHATYRKRENIIKGLFDINGEWVTDDRGLLNVATAYFEDLFQTSSPSAANAILEKVTLKVTNEMNQVLMKLFTTNEVWMVVKCMSPMKASGLDGFPALFYQKFWGIIGADISNFCLAILNGTAAMEEINNTQIVLIPKVDHPRNMIDFRPISLCNVIFKIVSKVLACRLAPMLEPCIDKAQGAFIPGRQISNNIMIAYEVLNSLHKRRVGKTGTFALKVDLSKAYDRVEWSFLEGMLLKLGFAEGWVRLIMKCVRTVSYSVCMNGCNGSRFYPSRGIMQGDPLSPYLFLVCAEGLSTLMNEAHTLKTIKAATIGRERLAVEHLLFADDCILFGGASVEGASNMKGLLQNFGNASGQRVNFGKSLVFFSSNVDLSLREQIGMLLGVRVSLNPEKYLGLPTMVGRNKKEAFNYYMDRYNKKTNNWGVRFLSMGGKEVLIKSVLQSIPVYAMNCFLLPASLCRALEQVMSRFWWRRNGIKRGIHWTTWNSLARPKSCGGLGFRELGKFNVALLAKQCWSLITHPDCFLAKVLKARYYPTSDFLSSNLGSNSSYIWKSLWSAKGLIEIGIGWRVGSGQDINIWNDAWLPGT
ncbi:hypothetical protein HRI_002702700 [Hibiscus trionum]|uniref:Reverse transcriptase domain-containing protein n=1 Tax=Hibiscus trionum TaxID=183268 RepID=A0A9W7M7D1_HIBTR|nr:hypothetical protein HRI_002702700 [Hibiscus trionum]